MIRHPGHSVAMSDGVTDDVLYVDVDPDELKSLLGSLSPPTPVSPPTPPTSSLISSLSTANRIIVRKWAPIPRTVLLPTPQDKLVPSKPQSLFPVSPLASSKDLFPAKVFRVVLSACLPVLGSNTQCPVGPQSQAIGLAQRRLAKASKATQILVGVQAAARNSIPRVCAAAFHMRDSSYFVALKDLIEADVWSVFG